MADDLNKQLGIQTQINKVLEQRTKVLEAQAGYLSGQTKMAQELCKALDCSDLEDMEERLNGIKAGMEEAAQKAGEMGDSTSEALQNASDAAGKGGLSGMLGGVTKHLTAGKMAAVGAGVGMITGLKGAASQAKGLVKLLGSTTKGFFSIGKSIVALPFDILGGLISQANALYSGMSPLREAIEDVREEFGDLSTGAGAAVMGSFRDMQSEAGNLAGSGRSLASVFGTGPGGAAAALKYMHENASQMGATFSVLKDQVEKMGASFVIFGKGLGLSGEAMKGIGINAKASGKSLEESLNETANYAIQMGKQFGFSAKEIGKSMGEMSKDVANFGTFAPKELAKMSVYAKKLGIDIKALTGVIDKFDNFEDAAKSASMLAQSFGMNIDAMAMMNEQDPAKRIDMMKKSFDATGKSVEDLSRQELKLLASQMGLSEEAAKAALSGDADYDEIAEGADKAEDSALAQADAMKELSKSIKKVFDSGNQSTSFFGALMDGFTQGVSRTKEYRDMLRNIHKSMRIVWRLGRDLGKAFVQLFPGIKDILGGIADMFNPARFQKMADGVRNAFKKAFDPKTGKLSMEKLFAGLSSTFSEFFGSGGKAWAKIWGGMKKMFAAIASGMIKMIPLMIKGMAMMIQKLADWLAKPKKEGSGQFGTAIKAAFVSAFETLKEALPQLVKAMGNLLKVLFEKHGGTIAKVGAAVGAIMLGKMLLIMALSAVKGAIAGKVIGIFSKFFGSATSGAASQIGSGADAKKMGKSLKGGFAPMGDGLRGFFESISKISPGQVIKTGLILALLVVLMGVSLIAFAATMVIVARIVATVPFAALAKGMFALVGAAVAIGALLLATAPLGNQAGLAAMAMSGLGMLMGAVLLGVAGVAYALSLVVVTKAMSAVNPTAAIVSLAVMAAAAAAMVALVVAGALLATPLTAIAVVGLIAGNLLLMAAAAGFVYTLNVVAQQVRKIKDPVGAALGFAMMAGMVVAMAVMAVALAYGAIAFTAGLVGMIPLWIFLKALPKVMEWVATSAKQLMSTGLDWKTAGKQFLGLAAVVGSLLLIAIVAALGIQAFAVGTIGLIAAGAFVFVLPYIVDLIGQSMETLLGFGLDWAAAAKQFLQLTLVFGTLGILAAIASYTGVIAAVGAVGLLLMTPFLYGLPKIVGWIADISKTMAEAADPLKIGKQFLGLSAVFALVQLLAITAVAAGVFGIFGAGGILLLSVFFKAMDLFLLPWLPIIRTGLDAAGDMVSLAKDMVALAVIVGALGFLAVASILLAPFAHPMVMWVAEKGFQAVSKLADAAMKYLAPALKTISDTDMGDPTEVLKKTQALATVIGAVASMGDIVIKIAALQVLSNATGSEQDILKGAADFMEKMMMGAMVLIVVLVKVTKNMKESQIKKLEAIGSVLGAVANLMTAIQPPPGLFEVMSSMAGGFFPQKVDVSAIMTSYATVMKDIMGSMMDLVVPMIEKMMAIDLGPKPEATKKKAEAIAAVMDAVGKMGGVLGAMAGGVVEMNKEQQPFFGSGPTIEETITSYMNVVEKIMGAMKTHIPVIVKTITDAADAVGGKPEEMKPKLEVVSLAMKSLSDFAGALGSMSGQIPEPGWFESDEDNLKEFFATTEKIVNAAIDYIPRIVNSLLGIKIANPEVAAQKMSVISDAMGAVANFAKVMEPLKGMTANEVYTAYGPALQGINWIMGYESSGVGKTVPELMTTLTAMEVGSSSEIIPKIESLTATLKPMKDFARGFKQFMGVVKGLKTDAVTNVVDQFAHVLEEMEYMHDTLATGIPTIDLGGVLNAFGENMSISTEKVTVNNKPINVTVNLSLSMDADEIAQGLSKRKGKYSLALSRSNSNPVSGTTDMKGLQ